MLKRRYTRKKKRWIGVFVLTFASILVGGVVTVICWSHYIHRLALLVQSKIHRMFQRLVLHSWWIVWWWSVLNYTGVNTVTKWNGWCERVFRSNSRSGKWALFNTYIKFILIKLFRSRGKNVWWEVTVNQEIMWKIVKSGRNMIHALKYKF